MFPQLPTASQAVSEFSAALCGCPYNPTLQLVSKAMQS